MSVSFEVPESGAPHLLGEGEEPPAAEGVEAAALVVVPGWTPEEAAAKVAQILTTGILIGYVARHGGLPSIPTMSRLVFHAAEFPSTGTALVSFLDRFVPKGGVADVGISASAALGEIGMAVAARLRPFQEPPPKQGERVVAGPAPGPAPQDPAEGAPGPAPQGSYRLPRDLVTVVQPRPDDSLVGIGL